MHRSRCVSVGRLACRIVPANVQQPHLVRAVAALHTRANTPLYRAQRNFKPARSYSVAAAKTKDEDMFCFQCEQTKLQKGCVAIGVCGKTPQVAKLQDLTIVCVKAVSVYAAKLQELGVPVSQEVYDLVCNTLFATVTNVNFDADRFSGGRGYISQLLDARDTLRAQCGQHVKLGFKSRYDESASAGVTLQLGDLDEISNDELAEIGSRYGVLSSQAKYGPDLHGVREMSLYGVKGLAAYYAHAVRLGVRDSAVDKGVIETLAWLECGPESERTDVNANLATALNVGKINLRVMQLLDEGHRLQMGTPHPKSVNMTPTPGPCLLVSGHDMHDLKRILEWTEGSGINVYTHGEMLPAHGYPELNKHSHLAGHFGGGWQLQQFEFAQFPGPVIVTTNCIIEPRKSYMDRVYTCNSVGWPGAKQLDMLSKEEFENVMKQATDMGGFTPELSQKYSEKDIMVGFGREAILDNADKVLSAIGAGALQHVFVVGGCDGSENKRSWFTDLVAVPDPVALTLADALKTDVNSLPISYCISWFEQKAVAVLLSMLHLGIKHIRLGPVMPAFVTKNVYVILHEKFNLMPIDLKRKRNVHEDLQIMMDNQGKELKPSTRRRAK